MRKKEYIEYCDLLNNTVIPSDVSCEDKIEILDDWVDKHVPSKLYKFRECNENNINAFRNQQIWFATGAKMNDDYDAVLYCNKDKILDELKRII